MLLKSDRYFDDSSSDTKVALSLDDLTNAAIDRKELLDIETLEATRVPVKSRLSGCANTEGRSP